jgi:streptogramin lyase
VSGRIAHVWLAAVALVRLSAGCEPAQCADADEDGYGLRCTAGLDCDDSNPERNVDCLAVPPPDCDASPNQPGCPCLEGQIAACYRGPAGTRAVGICRGGRVRCVAGHYGLCDGEVLPDPFEVCDLEDGDCDGRVDERVTSPCGACDPSCVGGVWGGADAPFEGGRPLALADDQSLTLATTTVDSSTVWVPNTEDGTLSRIDAATARETGRYLTAALGAVPPEPSRVAVDWNGDAWVLNRAFGGQGSATKVAGALERCVDRDGDGAITTSRGPDEVLPFGGDECVLLHVPVGGPASAGADGSVPRAIAIDGDRGLDDVSGGDPWIGLHGEQALVELDGTTGEVLRRLETPGFAAYMAAFDSHGVLWLGSQRGVLLRVDPALEPPDVTRIELDGDCYETYSLAIDAEDRLYLTGFACDRVWRYEPWRGVFEPLSVPASPRGAAIDGDTMWVAHTDGRASVISLETFSVDTTIDLDLGPAPALRPRETIGVATDVLGHVWLVSESGGPSGGGVATRLDATSRSVEAHVEVGRSPHAQGDLTGWQRIGAREPEGAASHVFEGCDDGFDTQWQRLHLDADLGTGGEIEVALRRGATREALATEPFRELGTVPGLALPVELELADGGVVEVRVVIRTRSQRSAPVLRRVGLQWGCGGPG